jgi:K+-transporting ATPase A subunit
MQDLVLAAVYAALVILGAWGVGRWMALVCDRPAGRLGALTRIEGAVCSLCGVDPAARQGWVA